MWFQEKALFSMGALLHNPSPGETFDASDLVRNFMMSRYMNLPIAEQEVIYDRMWMRAVEMRVGGDKGVVDGYIERFLDERDRERAAMGVEVSVCFVSLMR